MAKQITSDINIRIEQAIRKLDRYEKEYEQLKSTITETKQRQKEFAEQSARGTQAATKNILNFAKGFVGIGVAVAGATRVLNSAIKTVKEFEKSVDNLAAITGATGKDLDFLKQRAIDLSREVTLSATEIVEAFKLVGSAVPELLKSGDALAEVTEKAIILSEAATLDLGTAAKALGETINQFRLPVQEAERVINALAAASQLGAKEIPFVNDALSKFGGVAESAGVSIEVAIAAVETLGKVIPQAEIVGTNLRGILITLQTEAEKSGRRFNSLSEELELLSPDLNNITKLTKTFGDRNLLAIQTLIKSRDELGLLTEAITGTNTAYEQAAINTDNLVGQNQKLKNSWEAVILTIEDGEGVIGGVLKRLSKDTKEILDTFTDRLNFIKLGFQAMRGEVTENSLMIDNLIELIKDGTIEMGFFEEKVRSMFPEDQANEIIARVQKLTGVIGDLGDETEATSEELAANAQTIKDLKEALKQVNEEINNSAANEAALSPLIQRRNELQTRLNTLLGTAKKAEKDVNDQKKTRIQLALTELALLDAQEKGVDELLNIWENFSATQTQDTLSLSNIRRDSAQEELQSIGALLLANIDAREQGLISEAEYVARSEELEKELTDFTARQEDIKKQIRRDAWDEAINITASALRTIASLAKEGSDFQIALSIASIAASLAEGLANGIAMVARTENSLPEYIAGVATIIVNVAAAASEINKILQNANTPEEPSFSARVGTEDAPGGVTQLHRDEILWIPQHSKVFNKEAVNQYNDAIKAMNDGTFDKLYIDKKSLVNQAERAEDGKNTSFAENVANALMLNWNTENLQTEMYELNRKENTTHVLLNDIIKLMRK